MTSKNFAVLGSPITHSLSPQIHTAAYKVLGLEWAYTRKQVTEAEFCKFWQQQAAAYSGFSVTMPLKQLALQAATSAGILARISGVANTLLQLPDGSWHAENTDVVGLQEAFTQLQLPVTNTVILGAGATALSAALAAMLAGANTVEFRARRQDAAAATAKRALTALETLPITHDCRVLVGAELATPTKTAPTLTVSTLPGSVKAQLDPQLLTAPLFDVAYAPWPSGVSALWGTSSKTYKGLHMLTRQALLQLRLFYHGDCTAALPKESAVFAAMCAAVDLD